MTDPQPHEGGCLGCNTEAVTAMLEAKGVDPSRFTEVPRPRHNWGDVLPCDDCGRAWLVKPHKPHCAVGECTKPRSEAFYCADHQGWNMRELPEGAKLPEVAPSTTRHPDGRLLDCAKQWCTSKATCWPNEGEWTGYCDEHKPIDELCHQEDEHDGLFIGDRHDHAAQLAGARAERDEARGLLRRVAKQREAWRTSALRLRSACAELAQDTISRASLQNDIERLTVEFDRARNRASEGWEKAANNAIALDEAREELKLAQGEVRSWETSDIGNDLASLEKKLGEARGERDTSHRENHEAWELVRKLRAQVETLTGQQRETQGELSAVAAALHPHWGADDRNAYMPDLLPGMVERLHAEVARLRDTYENPGATHYEGCEDGHLACALRHLADSRAEVKRLRADDGEDQITEAWDTQSHAICDALGDEYSDDGMGFDYEAMVSAIQRLRTAEHATLGATNARDEAVLKSLVVACIEGHPDLDTEARLALSRAKVVVAGDRR